MFHDRCDAGRRLAQAVLECRSPGRTVVLALPRGGVPVAVPVAKALRAPLDLLLVRKVGALGNPELAVGAVAEGDPPITVIDHATLDMTGEPPGQVLHRASKEMAEIERRRATYLAGRARVPLEGANVVLVDDGLATGTTVRAAVAAVRSQRPARVMLAVPLGSVEGVAAIASLVDELICLEQPDPFFGVGGHYDDFHQVTDGEVLAALASLAPDRPGR
jgi:putative phosphoribosyl transferase